MTGPPATRWARPARDDTWVLFGGAALLLVSWTVALAVLVPRPAGHPRSRERHPAPVSAPVISPSPSRGAATALAPAARPSAARMPTRWVPRASASARANDASDPAGAGPPATGDGAVIRLATRWLAAFRDWEVGRAAASARRTLSATSTPALAQLVTATAPRAEGRLRGPASVGRLAAFREGRGFTVIAELHRGHQASVIELDVARTRRGLRISGFDL